jgi:hypothetical protein
MDLRRTRIAGKLLRRSVRQRAGQPRAVERRTAAPARRMDSGRTDDAGKSLVITSQKRKAASA